jgi:hypothetical protein
VYDGRDLPDDAGIELANRDEAHRQAIVTAGEILRESGRRSSRATFGKCTSRMRPVRRYSGSGSLPRIACSPRQSEDEPMDITVRRRGEGSTWSLEDLLGRPMGTVEEHPPKHFTIHPAGQAVQTMRGLSPGPYASLDTALAEIETYTRGVCRMDIDHGQ